jgi:hypothetical protein
VAAGVVAVVESSVHERESRPRRDLGLLELLRELSGGYRGDTIASSFSGRRRDVLRLRDRLQELTRAADVDAR